MFSKPRFVKKYPSYVQREHIAPLGPPRNAHVTNPYMLPSEVDNRDLIQIYDVSEGVTKSISFDELCIAIANNSNVGRAKL